MKETTSDNAKLKTKRRLRTGYLVFAALFSLKVIEYLVVITVRTGNLLYLSILALASAGLIVYYYKHIHQLWDRSRNE